MDTGMVRQKLNRDFRIDCLRGLAILSVLVLHFHLAYNLLKSPLGWLLPGPYLSNLVRNGNYGVTVFFVISGYLITSTSVRRFGVLGNVSPQTFYSFRFARIFPCLLLVLAIITGLALAGVEIFRDNAGVPLWMADLSVLTFWHNVMMAKFGYFNYCLNVFWSLSVEEVFYLSFPLICVALRRTRWIALVWVAAVIAGPIYRGMNSHDEIRFLYGDLACFDAIAIGCLTALLVRRARVSEVNRNLLQGAALAGMTWIYVRAGIDSSPVWGISAMAFGASVFLFAEGAHRTGTETALSTPHRALLPIGWLGSHSYELYLFHIVLLAGLRSLLSPKVMQANAKPQWLVFFLLVSAAVAWAIARYYSEPLNVALRARLSERRIESVSF